MTGSQKFEWVKPELEQLRVEETLTKPNFETEGTFNANGSPNSIGIGPGLS